MSPFSSWVLVLTILVLAGTWAYDGIAAAVRRGEQMNRESKEETREVPGDE